MGTRSSLHVDSGTEFILRNALLTLVGAVSAALNASRSYIIKAVWKLCKRIQITPATPWYIKNINAGSVPFFSLSLRLSKHPLVFSLRRALQSTKMQPRQSLSVRGPPSLSRMAPLFSNPSFLHPDDAGWPGLKPKPQEKRVTPSSSHRDVRDGLPNKPPAPSSPPRRFEPRAAPLLSQDDLFLKKLLTEDDPIAVPHNQTGRQVGFLDDHRDRGTDNKRSKDDVLRNDNRNRSQRPYEDFSYLGVKRPTSSANASSAYTRKAYLVGLPCVFTGIVRTEQRQASGTKRKLSEDLDPPGSSIKPNSQTQDRHRSSPLRNTSSVIPNVCEMPISPCSFTSGIRLEAANSPTLSDQRQQVVSLFRELSRSLHAIA